MLKAKDIMTENVLTISPEATLADVIELLIAKKISGMPVIDAAEKMIGIISEKDILNFAFSGNIHNTKVREAMTEKVVSFPPDSDADKISLAISENKFRRVPIIEDGKVVGIVSRRDIIRILLSRQK
ncbi:MAG: CBS domain-containing protein [bacterium]